MPVSLRTQASYAHPETYMNLSNRKEKSFTSAHAGALALSAAAAATAVWVEVQARRAERENLPKGKFIYIDGVRLHYLTRGEGPPVVLLHGNTVTLADFQASGLIDRLARSHRVIVFDRPGYGHSSRPRDRLWTASAQAALLHRALARLGVDRAVLVGHSMGTMVALAMAIDYPESISRLVLIGGYYYPTVRVDALLTAPVALPLLGDVMRYTVSALSGRAMLNRLVKGMFAPNQIPADFFSALSREMMLRPVQLRANAEDAAFMMPEARFLSRRYHQLRAPVTLIAGEADKVVDVDVHSVRLHDELGQSELHLVPQTGHMAHYFAQDLIVAAVDRSLPTLTSEVHEARMGNTGPAAQEQTELAAAERIPDGVSPP
jgi:pimeloyl-ACP methyl ester carboxylesterase